MRLSGLILFLCSGCWVSEAQLQQKIADLPLPPDVETDDTTPVPDCQIDTITPAFGTEAGGMQAELVVKDLVGIPTVRFGQRQAEVVSMVDDETVLIVTPEKNVGSAKITVETETQSCSLEDAYEFWPDGTDKQGAIGAVHWYTYQGDYWQSGEPHGSAWIAFVEPTDYQYRYLFAEMPGQCVSNYGFDLSLLTFHAPGGTLVMEGSADTLQIPYDGEGIYATNLSSPPSSEDDYTLQELGRVGWPSFTLERFLRTPRSISILQPAVSGDSPGTVLTAFNSTVDVEWTDGGAGDYVLASVTRLVEDVPVEEITCVWEDDGSATIPATVWTGWDYTPYSQYLMIRLGRATESTALLPYDNSRAGVAGVYWTTGAVWTL